MCTAAHDLRTSSVESNCVSLARTVTGSRSLVCRDLGSALSWPLLSFISSFLYQLDWSRTDEGQIRMEFAAAL